MAGEEGDGADAASQISPPRIIFHPAKGVTADAVGQAQARLRRRILRACVGRGFNFSGIDWVRMTPIGQGSLGHQTHPHSRKRGKAEFC